MVQFMRLPADSGSAIEVIENLSHAQPAWVFIKNTEDNVSQQAEDVYRAFLEQVSDDRPLTTAEIDAAFEDKLASAFLRPCGGTAPYLLIYSGGSLKWHGPTPGLSKTELAALLDG